MESQQVLAGLIGGMEQAIYDNDRYLRAAEDKLKVHRRNLTIGGLAVLVGILLFVALPGFLALLLAGAGILTFLTAVVGLVDGKKNIKAAEVRMMNIRIALNEKRAQQEKTR